MHKLAGWGSGGGGGRALARAHRCRKATKEVSVAPKIRDVSSVTGGERFCCDSDSSWLKPAIKRPPRQKVSSLSHCSPGSVPLAKAHGPSGKRWWWGYVTGADWFLYEGCAKSSAFELGRKQEALQSLTPAPSLGRFIRADSLFLCRGVSAAALHHNAPISPHQTPNTSLLLHRLNS